MDKYHKDIVNRSAKRAAILIEGKLPESLHHPQGRNPMAHIYQVINTIMGCSVQYCSNDRIDDVLSIIQDCIDLVEVYDVAETIRHKYEPHTSVTPATLEQFF